MYIINKAGGLIFQLNMSPHSPSLSSNDHLRIASTFHSIHAIARLLHSSSNASVLDGIESLRTDTFQLQCFQSITGIKFILFAEPGTPDVDLILHSMYDLYCDYVLKNPFYGKQVCRVYFPCPSLKP